MLEIRKPQNTWIIGSVVDYIVMVTTVAVYLYIDANLIFVLVWCLIFGAIVIRCQIATGRVLQMDCYGCTIRFFEIRKQYKWNDFKVKRIEYCKNMRIFDLPYKLKCVVFSPEPIKKKGKWNVENYCFFVHPFSVVYIFLIPKNRLAKLGNVIYDNLCYVVEEELFMEKMKEWNVEIE